MTKRRIIYLCILTVRKQFTRLPACAGNFIFTTKTVPRHWYRSKPIARQIVLFLEQTNNKAQKITNKVKISVEKLCTDREIFIDKILYFEAKIWNNANSFFFLCKIQLFKAWSKFLYIIFVFRFVKSIFFTNILNDSFVSGSKNNEIIDIEYFVV